MQKQSEANLLPLFWDIYLTKDANNNCLFFVVILMFMRLLKQIFTESTLIYEFGCWEGIMSSFQARVFFYSFQAVLWPIMIESCAVFHNNA